MNTGIRDNTRPAVAMQLIALLLLCACGQDAHTGAADPRSASAPGATDGKPGAKPAPQPRSPGKPQVLPVPADGVKITSDYSTIEIRERGTVRTLYFVRDTGQRVVESQMDLAHPEKLLIRYTRSMFASYLITPNPKRVLIIGLGAGSMVRFLQYHDPDVKIEAVDIDPVIVEVAGSYFGTRPNDKVELIAADGLAYIRETQRDYDVIYMDAFLKPSMKTDETGVPLRMKTIEFYQEMQAKLTDAGIVVFNLNFHRDVQEDIDTIAEAFTSTHVFRVPRSGNIIVLATRQKTDYGEEYLRKGLPAARETFGNRFSPEPFLEDLVPDGKVLAK